MDSSSVTSVSRQAWLFVFAHQDDEMTIAPWVRRAAAFGTVSCLYLTDGGALAGSTQRDAESLRVLKRLGVAPESVRFVGSEFGVPDSALADNVDAASEAGWAAIAEGPRPTVIACPAWEGGHQDHDAAHLIAQAWARRLEAPAWEFSLYHGFRTGLAPFRVMTPIELGAEREVEQIATSLTWADRGEGLATPLSYPSQWRSMLGLYAPLATVYGSRARMTLRRAEPGRVRERPHAGKLLYEKRGKCSYEAFERATADFRDRHVLAHANVA